MFAWCGGAVLLRREYLDDVGIFDERLFLYYEDTDLSWRGTAQGVAVSVRAGLDHSSPPCPIGGSRLADLPLLHATQSAAGAGEERASLARLARRTRSRTSNHRPDRPQGHTPAVHAPHAALGRGVVPLEGAAGIPPAAARHVAGSADDVAHRQDAQSVMVWEQHKEMAAMSDRLQVAVYDLYWSTLGGGEQVDGTIASVLSVDHDVTLLGPEPIDVDRIHERLGVDLSGCDFRCVIDDACASEASAEFDLFVNGTYRSTAINRAPAGWYYVHFPEPPTGWRDIVGQHVARAGVRALTRPGLPARLDEVRAGFDRRVRRTEHLSTYQRYLANSRFTAGWVEQLWGVPATVVYPPVRADGRGGGQAAARAQRRAVLRPSVRALQEAARDDRRLRGPGPRRLGAGAGRRVRCRQP